MSSNPGSLDRVLSRILDALDEMMSHALDASTRQQIVAEEKRLEQIMLRAQLLIAYLREKQRPGSRVHPPARG